MGNTRYLFDSESILDLYGKIGWHALLNDGQTHPVSTLHAHRDGYIHVHVSWRIGDGKLVIAVVCTEYM